jgi:hAT family C-terminal dimerisation region
MVGCEFSIIVFVDIHLCVKIKHHQSQYPTLSRMARDYLAIQGSATPSECAFSGGGLTGTKRRNRLNADAFESLQLLKSAYRNGHISAADDATQHLDALIAALEDEVDDDMPCLTSLNS